jgi:hypothetical protein
MPPGFETFAAVAVTLPSGRLGVIFNDALRGLPLAPLVALLSHEVSHQDTVNSREEEVLAKLVETVAYLKMLQRDSKVGAFNTDFVRIENQSLLALVNSAGPDGKGFGINPAEQPLNPPQIFVGGVPGAETVPDVEAYLRFIVGQRPDISQNASSCASNPTVQKYMEVLTGTVPASPVSCDGTAITHLRNGDFDSVIQIGTDPYDKKANQAIAKANALGSALDALQADLYQ